MGKLERTFIKRIPQNSIRLSEVFAIARIRQKSSELSRISLETSELDALLRELVELEDSSRQLRKMQKNQEKKKAVDLRLKAMERISRYKKEKKMETSR